MLIDMTNVSIAEVVNVVFSTRESEKESFPTCFEPNFINFTYSLLCVS